MNAVAALIAAVPLKPAELVTVFFFLYEISGVGDWGLVFYLIFILFIFLYVVWFFI
jgi:hypothetical protein